MAARTTAPFDATNLHLPPPPATIHFIGIGGIGMSGLARILLAWGYRITGSDAAASGVTAALQELGADIVIGHDDPTFASLADILVTTPRAEENARIEIEAARAAGVMHVQRGLMLAMLANARRSVAVAGSHGKSTTTGMLTSALRTLGGDPSYAIGAVLAETGLNAAPGNGPYMPVEADEFARAFLWLKPEVAIITSVAYDHPDVYPTQQDYDDAFVEFTNGILAGGRLVIPADDAGSQRVLSSVKARGEFPFEVVTFGSSDDADWRIAFGERGGMVTLPDGRTLPVTPSVAGRHNVRNTVAGAIALEALGFEPEAAVAALTGFTGVGRRFEHKGTFDGIDVVDDYAHHPDEIAVNIQAAHERFPNRKVIVAFQPHTYSRTKVLLDEFAASLSGADEVVLLEVYPSGEPDVFGVSSADIFARLTTPAHQVAKPEDAARKLAEVAKAGDVVLTLGAGDITTVGANLLGLLRERTPLGAGPVAGAEASPRPVPRRPRAGAAAKAAAIAIPGHEHLKVHRDAAMSLYTTMRIGGPADFLVRVQEPDDMAYAMQWAANEGVPVTAIGGGSNLLVGDGGIRGLVIVARTPGERAANLLSWEDEDDHVRVTVGAQAPLSWVGRYCAEQGWAGMDWGVGLPGQIGGATVNNAGAHGTELKDHLVEVELLHLDGNTERVPASWMEAGYRRTRIKVAGRPRPWTILRSTFLLLKDDPTKLVQLADEHANFRKRTQPTGACSGSTFANPPGDYAGRLIEQAGLKGYAIGPMLLSPKHANWVVNTGGGTAAEAWALIQHARETVRERFGVELHPEIERVGDHTDDV
ncbi:MAG: UDP-N-acetylmuramate--L-alanine ligase [Thermomicrobiales bacterium]